MVEIQWKYTPLRSVKQYRSTFGTTYFTELARFISIYFHCISFIQLTKFENEY